MNNLQSPTPVNTDHNNRRHWKTLTLALAITFVTLTATAILHAV